MRTRTVIAGALSAVTLALPFVASANSLEDVQAQIAALLVQVTEFQAQLLALKAAQNTIPTPTFPTGSTATSTRVATSTPAPASTLHAFVFPISSSSTSSAAGSQAVLSLPTASPNTSTSIPLPRGCVAVARTLSLGARGDDVSSLQNFLVSQGLLSTDSATGFFGSLTQSALQKWQATQGIVSSGSPETTGWGTVGARTRAALAANCGGVPLPPNDTISVGAQGLDVQAIATTNVKGSCAALSYTLSWGDGSPSTTFSIPANTCTALQHSLSHTYTKGGSYTITLAASKLYTISAPITLTAPSAACTIPHFATDTVPYGRVGQPYTLPLFVTSSTDTLSVSLSGGPASLTLEKKIAVNASTTAASTIWSLTGTPTTTATYSISFKATNACGSISRTIELPIAQ